MTRRKTAFGLASLIIIVCLFGCSVFLFVTGCVGTNQDNEILSPDQPVTITVWHYYNGLIKEQFDSLVSEFNETIGADKGIVVNASSYGDVEHLANEVFAAANQVKDAQAMPDIFASYADNAWRINQITELVSLDEYFSADELSAFRMEFLEEGKFVDDGKYYIVPIAKASENLFVNKTLWEPFAAKHNFSEIDLLYWESLAEVAAIYYEETGMGFFGIDANANYMIQAAKQLGDNIYYLDEQGQASLEISNELADHIWKYFYEPYIRGHYVKSGRFSSDDARTGSVLAYTGSTAGAGYFPQEITINDNEIFQIEPLVLPYPYFREGEPYAVQQGAGMCISRSEPKSELAAYQFLKWFTLSEQNIDFAVSTGYFPVRQNDLTIDKLLSAYDTANKDVSAIRSSIVATSKMFEEYTLHNNKPFNGSYELRNLLERHLFEKIVSDLELIQKRVELGEDREAVIDDLISKDNQDLWVKQLHEDAMAIFSKY